MKNEDEEQHTHRQCFNHKPKHINRDISSINTIPFMTILGAIIYILCCIFLVYVIY